MAAAGVTCRAFVVLRFEITRALGVASVNTARKYRHETTWCRRTISHRSLSTTRGAFAPPSLSPILSRETHDHKDPRNNKEQPKHSKTLRETAAADSTTTISAGAGNKCTDRKKRAKHNDVIVEYHRGLPRITVPLPSRKEKCIFTLKPITNTVADFIDMLKLEDHGIDRAVITTIDGTRIACGNTIESLLEADFKLVINDVTYDVSPPNQQLLTAESIDQLSDVKTVVGQLYQTLNCQEHNSVLEREVMAELEQVMLELEPLELKRQELEASAERRASIQPWLGLVAMAVQFGILARLTWWEYSWDIMEPVTYFVTYGTGMIWYIYFLLTRQEYMLPEVLNRRYLVVLHKRATKMGLDLNHYNTLKERAYELETTLKIIRGPLWNQKNEIEQKRRERLRSRSSSSSSSSSSRSPSSSPSPSPSPSPSRKPNSRT